MRPTQRLRRRGSEDRVGELVGGTGAANGETALMEWFWEAWDGKWGAACVAVGYAGDDVAVRIVAVAAAAGAWGRSPARDVGLRAST